MDQLAYLAERFDKGYGHFTTRQNIQYNWPKLEDVPDMLDALADVGMHAIQTSGNTIRNVTADHFAGAAADEIEDPRPVAELLRQWSTDHPEFQFLPRKFKIAITGSPNDRAVTRAHDIGCGWCATTRRTGVRSDRRRRPRAHADGRQGDPRVPAQGGPAAVCRGHRQRLQPARAARQQVQGADQDHRPRERAGHDPGFGGVKIRTNQGGFCRVRSGTSCTNRTSLRPARLQGGRPRRLRGGQTRQPGVPVVVRHQPDRAQGTGLCHRLRLDQKARGNPGRRDHGTDAGAGADRAGLWAQRTPDQPRTERDPAACPCLRPRGGLCGAAGGGSGDGEHRAHLRHHRLPGDGLLRAWRRRGRSRWRRKSRCGSTS
jgi:hypothetical protein